MTDEEEDKLRAMGWVWSSSMLRFRNPAYKNVYPVASNRQVLWASGPWAPVPLYLTALAAAVAQVIGE